ncbi:thiamine phosphate synthase [Paraliomyxa miuraensis]|uniref:thiamine phosphate synthase n=1 Tax=Paraliomyxa miuraensis TaxID=376150 RepID=UPI00224F695E|nr:thiamine phosphate synthase [Paraliomyxa miuraensis]MCX4245617.1 thiamine phosphate synthase [Paraliomyxa miuraensis]
MHEGRRGPRLLAITPPAGPVDPGVVSAWDAGRAVGMAVLLREPGTPPGVLVGADHRLTPLRLACARAGVPCLLSVDAAMLAELGVAVGASGVMGVQLRGDPSARTLERARRALPEGWLLGRSCHGAPAPMGERVDYSVLAPIFEPRTASPTPGSGKRAVGLDPLRAFAAVEPHVLALGGITPERARACIEAGAFGVAGIAGFFGPLATVADNVGRLAHAVVTPRDDAAPPP